MWAYIDRFCLALLHAQDAVPAEVLYHFIHGLSPLVHAQVLVYDPEGFERAALMVERVAGAHGEPTNHPYPPCSIPIELRARQGPSSYSKTH